MKDLLIIARNSCLIFFQINILVNNAGRSQRSLIEKCPMEVDREVLEINTFSPISLTKAVLPHFLERKAGHVVYTSSVAGKIGKENLDLHLLYLLVYSWLASLWIFFFKILQIAFHKQRNWVRDSYCLTQIHVSFAFNSLQIF